MKRLWKIDNRISGFLAGCLSSMVCFWIVSGLVFAILFWQVPKSPLEWVMYVVQTVFQGIALPVLAIVSKREGAKQSKVLKETHDAVMNELALIKQLCGACQYLNVKEIPGR